MVSMKSLWTLLLLYISVSSFIRVRSAEAPPPPGNDNVAGRQERYYIYLAHLLGLSDISFSVILIYTRMKTKIRSSIIHEDLRRELVYYSTELKRNILKFVTTNALGPIRSCGVNINGPRGISLKLSDPNNYSDDIDPNIFGALVDILDGYFKIFIEEHSRNMNDALFDPELVEMARVVYNMSSYLLGSIITQIYGSNTPVGNLVDKYKKHNQKKLEEKKKIQAEKEEISNLSAHRLLGCCNDGKCGSLDPSKKKEKHHKKRNRGGVKKKAINTEGSREQAKKPDSDEEDEVGLLIEKNNLLKEAIDLVEETIKVLSSAAEHENSLLEISKELLRNIDMLNNLIKAEDGYSELTKRATQIVKNKQYYIFNYPDKKKSKGLRKHLVEMSKSTIHEQVEKHKREKHRCHHSAYRHDNRFDNIQIPD